jgi:hypothetical protein
MLYSNTGLLHNLPIHRPTVPVTAAQPQPGHYKRLSGRADQVVLYQGVRIPIVDGFTYFSLWMDSISIACGGLMAALRELVPVAVNAGVRYMPHAMVLLV